MTMVHVLVCLAAILTGYVFAFSRTTLPGRIRRNLQTKQSASLVVPLSSAGTVVSGALNFTEGMSFDWEIDCYSRPVMALDKKKLWEILITDSTGRFRYLKEISSSSVNSKNLRKVIEDVLNASPVRPRTVRYFRRQMVNMLGVALSGLELEAIPSGRTGALCAWAEEREKYVYPTMPGYDPRLVEKDAPLIESGRTDRLPDVVKAEAYAFVALPAQVLADAVIGEKVERGYVAPLQMLPQTGLVHGVNLCSRRAAAIAAWMDGMELCGVKVNQIEQELHLLTGIDSQFVLAPLTDKQRVEAKIFEQGKQAARGYHFLSVQESVDSDEVEGFWLFRSFDMAR